MTCNCVFFIVILSSKKLLSVHVLYNRIGYIIIGKMNWYMYVLVYNTYAITDDKWGQTSLARPDSRLRGRLESGEMLIQLL